MTTNEDRAKLAAIGLRAYRDATQEHGESTYTVLKLFLCDAVHLCDALDYEWDQVVEDAFELYREECSERLQDLRLELDEVIQQVVESPPTPPDVERGAPYYKPDPDTDMGVLRTVAEANEMPDDIFAIPPNAQS